MALPRALLWIGWIVVIAVAAVLAFATTSPATVSVSRSAIINAPADRIYPFINDFHQWNVWSPFDKLDPGLRKTFSGPASGVGAVCEWDGSGRVGTGRMENIEATAPSRVVIQFDVSRPVEGRTRAEFALIPDGGSTRVTWAMDGPSPYIGKVAGIFLDMDKLIGNELETGLASLKVAAEK